jgi:opacity protein-like surface antigen
MKQILVILTFMCFSLATFSQQDTITTAATDSIELKSALTVGVSFVSNADYNGQRSIEKMPYAAVVASYKHRSGFFVNALSYRLLNKESEGFASAYGAGLGYNIDLKKGWAADLGYQYTFFPKHSPFLQAANPHSATAAITSAGAISTKVEGNYSFGKTNDFFLTLSASKQISLFSFSQKDLVTFTPQFDVIGGTQRFYNYYINQKTIRDSLTGTLLDPITGGNQSGTDTTSQMVTSFDLLSYNLKLPITFSRANYLIELSTQFSLLSDKAQIQPGQLNTFFSASFYYQF